MSTNPAEVHPDHDLPTPSNIDDWSDDQLEQYRRAKTTELTRDAEERRRSMSQQQRETVELLGSTQKDAYDDALLDTVQVGDLELTVTSKLTGEVETKLDRVAGSDSLDDVVGTMIDTILYFVVDADADADVDDPAVWRAYYDRYGTEGLFDAFEQIADPAMERREDLKFRGDHGRRGHSGRDR